MKKPYHGGRSTGRKFGGGGGGGGWKKDFGGRGSDRAMMHDAKCAGCGRDCQVPFRPNGRKPVYCNACFKKDGDSGSSRFNEPSFRKPAYQDRRSAPPASSSSGVDEQLRLINDKLDAIMDALRD